MAKGKPQPTGNGLRLLVREVQITRQGTVTTEVYQTTSGKKIKKQAAHA